LFLSQLLKEEFIFSPGSAESNLDATLVTLHDHDVLTVESENGERLQDPAAALADRRAPLYIKLSDRERSIGRENFDFYCFLIW
jgi:hypothetical protein